MGMNGKELAVINQVQAGSIPQADHDNQVIAMWLHGRPHTTQRAYAYEVQGLLAAVNEPLKHITLGAGVFLCPGRPSASIPGPGY